MNAVLVVCSCLVVIRVCVIGDCEGLPNPAASEGRRKGVYCIELDLGY